jgi:hypothetical protein
MLPGMPPEQHIADRSFKARFPLEVR